MVGRPKLAGPCRDRVPGVEPVLQPLGGGRELLRNCGDLPAPRSPIRGNLSATNSVAPRQKVTGVQKAAVIRSFLLLARIRPDAR